VTWWQRLRRRSEAEAQLDKELRFHLDQHAADLIARGIDPDEARRRARLALGGLDQLKEGCRDVRGTRWLEDLLIDIRYAIRTFRQLPGFAGVAVLILALGIGATTVMLALTELTRTPEQTILAYFWTDTNFIAQWHRALRAIVETHVPDIGDRARLFALASLAVADAFITSWESKLHFNFWRPVTAIQEGEFDGNPKTDGDPDWQPLLNTPPYPDYTSGANNLSGAITRTLALFFGTDDFDFTITSNSPNLTDPATRARNYSNFSQAAEEVVEVRILHGAHFRSADEDARQQGGRVAHWVFHHFLEPVHAPQR
jgi:hypothetical protein